MSRYGAVHLDGIGRILVEHAVLEEYPPGSQLWNELGPVLTQFLASIRMLMRAERLDPYADLQYRIYGVPNIQLRLTLVVGKELDGLIEEDLWIELMNSSVNGKAFRELFFVRREPPEHVSHLLG